MDALYEKSSPGMPASPYPEQWDRSTVMITRTFFNFCSLSLDRNIMVNRAIFSAKISFLFVILYDLYRIFVQGFMTDSIDKMISVAMDSVILFAALFCIVFVLYSVFR